MKAKDILRWIINESIEGEYLNTIDVPNDGDESWEQNESWWLETFGGLPPMPIAAGKYLYYYDSAICEAIHTTEKTFKPDAQVELSVEDGFDYIYLYKLED